MKVLWFANNPCEAVEYLTNEDVRTIGWQYTLCQYLRQQENIELHVAFFWGHVMDAFIYKDVTYHPIFRKGMDTRMGRYWTLLQGQFSNRRDETELRLCLQTINEVAPDVIHVHGSEDMFGLITQCKSLHVPVVLSIQGLLSVYQNKFFSGISKDEVSRNESLKKKILLSGFPGLYRDFCRRAKREVNMFRSLQYVIGRTQWDRRCALALGQQAQYFTVNEILRSQFMAAEWSGRQPHKAFAIVTTISSGIYKGLEVIYQTAQMLTSMHFPFVWTVIGMTSTDETVRIIERLYKLRAEDIQIQLMGSKSADEMVQIMQQSDLYVQTSHIENSPNSLCEAMAMGMPIIASYAGGTSSMLQEGKEGVLLQDGNPYELAGAIYEARRDFDRAVQMGKNARRRAAERHNPDNVVRELIHVYKVLCALT